MQQNATNLEQKRGTPEKIRGKSTNLLHFASFCSISLHVVDFFAFCCSFDFCLTFSILFLIFLESVFGLFLSRPVSGSPRPTLF